MFSSPGSVRSRSPGWSRLPMPDLPSCMQCKPDDLLSMNPPGPQDQGCTALAHCGCAAQFFRAPTSRSRRPVLLLEAFVQCREQSALRCTSSELAEQHPVLCRFRMCSLVTARPSMRFYAGMALMTQEGEPLGAL